MKQGFIYSLLLHAFVVGVILSIITFAHPVVKKDPTPISVAIVKPFKPEPPKAIEPPKEEPQQQKPLPVKTSPSKPVSPTPVIPTPIVAAAVAADSPQDIPTAPVQNTPPPVAPHHEPVAPPHPSASEVHSAKERYLAYVRQTIDQRKTYPKNAKRLKQTGTVKIRFILYRDGAISNASVVEGSGFELLDGATLSLLNSLGTLKPFPKELEQKSMEIILPIEYSLR